MPVLNRRTRIVSFRLSQEEYENLVAGCVSNGARSLSDYARTAACRFLDNRKTTRGEKQAERSIRKLRSRVEELDHLVQQLTLEMSSHRALEGRPAHDGQRGSQ